MARGCPARAENTVVDLTVLAAVVFAFGLVSGRLEGTVLTAPIVFVVAGFVLGPWGLGLVEFDLDDHTVLLVGGWAKLPSRSYCSPTPRGPTSLLCERMRRASATSRYRDAAHHRAGDPDSGAGAHRSHFLGGGHRGHRPCAHRRCAGTGCGE